MKIKKLLDQYELVCEGDINNLPSETEPDQAMSVREIISRYARGVSLDVKTYEPFYSDDEIPDIQSMDLEEIASYREHLVTERYRLEKELNDRRFNRKQPGDEGAVSEAESSQATDEREVIEGS